MNGREEYLKRASCLVVAVISISMLVNSALAAENIGTLGSRPRWNVLEHYQGTITREEFQNLVQNVYCTHGMPEGMITIQQDSTRVLMNRGDQSYFTLRFAPDERSRKH